MLQEALHTQDVNGMHFIYRSEVIVNSEVCVHTCMCQVHMCEGVCR